MFFIRFFSGNTYGSASSSGEGRDNGYIWYQAFSELFRDYVAVLL